MFISCTEEIGPRKETFLDNGKQHVCISKNRETL